jgi:hypothetical protein
VAKTEPKTDAPEIPTQPVAVEEARATHVFVRFAGPNPSNRPEGGRFQRAQICFGVEPTCLQLGTENDFDESPDPGSPSWPYVLTAAANERRLKSIVGPDAMAMILAMTKPPKNIEQLKAADRARGGPGINTWYGPMLAVTYATREQSEAFADAQARADVFAATNKDALIAKQAREIVDLQARMMRIENESKKGGK